MIFFNLVVKLFDMKRDDTLRLDEIDPEDIEDVLLMLEKSFNLSLSYHSFKDVKTFGDICDIYLNNPGLHLDDCTSQQAFYKVRNAIAFVQPVNKELIMPESRLQDLFPRAGRRIAVSRMEKELDARIGFLAMKDWLFWVLFIGILVSLGAFFFSWKIALASLSFFILLSYIADKLSKELALSTVAELVLRFQDRCYFKARRAPGTVNRNEIINIIRRTFANQLYIDEKDLTRNAVLGWAK